MAHWLRRGSGRRRSALLRRCASSCACHGLARAPRRPQRLRPLRPSWAWPPDRTAASLETPRRARSHCRAAAPTHPAGGRPITARASRHRQQAGRGVESNNHVEHGAPRKLTRRASGNRHAGHPGTGGLGPPKSAANERRSALCTQGAPAKLGCVSLGALDVCGHWFNHPARPPGIPAPRGPTHHAEHQRCRAPSRHSV